jgi:hypothetical protein
MGRKSNCLLNQYLEQIRQDRLNNLTYSQIAVKYDTTVGAVAGFLSRNLISQTKKKIKPIPLNVSTPTLIKHIKDGQCKFPIGDPKKKDFHFCAKDQKLNSVYCKEHHKLCYIKPAPLKYTYRT